MWVIVHLEDLLLLSCQSLMGDLALIVLLLLPIHHCETHGTWHKDVVVWVRRTAIWALGVDLRVLSGALLDRLELLKLSLL
jgi:hypothetical protein